MRSSVGRISGPAIISVTAISPSEVVTGSCATDAREPGQDRKVAAFIGIVCVPQIAWSSLSNPGFFVVMMRECRPIDRGSQPSWLVEKRLWSETRHTSNSGNKICGRQGFSPVPQPGV